MAEVVQLPFPKVSGWWVTGLVDGEGCFYSSLRFRSGSQAFKGRGGRRYPSMEFQARFEILMRADDAGTLKKVETFFGVGSVSKFKRDLKRSGKSGSNPNPSVEYRCGSLGDLRSVIVPHFERFPLQSKKRVDFEIWKQTLEFYAEIDAPANHGWWKRDPAKLTKLRSLVSGLREGRVFQAQAGGGI